MIAPLITGGLIAALVWAAWTLPTSAQSVHDLRGTTVTLQPTTRHGAVAEIIMNNAMVNSDKDEGTFTLDLGGFAVEAEFDWDHRSDGADAVTITPPEGYICYPSCVLIVIEGGVGTMWIYSLEGVGM